MRKPEAVLFDMDGVLTDSEPVILKASILGLREYGIDPQPEDFRPFIGTGEDNFIGGVARKHGLTYDPSMKKRVYEIYLEIVRQELVPFDGVAQLLATLRTDGYHLALASSADYLKIHANLEAAGIDISLFDVVIGGEDIVHKKPAPDIYLKTAELLGIPPEQCIVVEDALNGVEAARAAGMHCIGVCTSFSAEELKKAGAVFTAGSTAGVIDILRGI